MIDCSIVVSTFGNYKWQLQAQERALPSAKSFGLPVIYNHKETLHEARNAGLYEVKTEFVCHLDADDELAPGFFEHMSKVDGDLRPPSVNHVHERATFMPRVVGRFGVHNHVCVADCLEEGNWLVVGTVDWRSGLSRALVHSDIERKTINPVAAGFLGPVEGRVCALQHGLDG